MTDGAPRSAAAVTLTRAPTGGSQSVVKLAGKVALVTGAARGIGRGIALALAGEGVHVAAADLAAAHDPAVGYRLARPADLEETVRALEGRGIRALGVVGDVTRAADAGRLVRETVARLGGLDIVVNNAGVLVGGPFDQLTEAQFDRMMSVNVKGVVLVTQAALPELRARGGGAIVNIASISGKTGRAFTAGYAASKFAVVGLTQGLAQELGPANIRVNAVCPGFLRTTMWTDGVAPARARIPRCPGQRGLRHDRPPAHPPRPGADAGRHRRGGRLPLPRRQRDRHRAQRRGRRRDALIPRGQPRAIVSRLTRGAPPAPARRDGPPPQASRPSRS